MRTLTNAIRAERIHQAYLFTGSRGIGKTSIARIFAKVLRCENVIDSPEGIRSCDQCSSCREITAGNSVDVIEIDGASNNGVDAVREIRENAKYLPSRGKRKIYIIDEVHMLTTAAFNALLKTLEEPPAHVIFIFATTEPHKIPATILSRVQRFDYRRVTVAQIQQRLLQVTKAENVTAEAGALALIARAAEGSMRDSLSLLDQVIAFSGNQVSVESVRDSIGLIGSQTLVGILRGVFQKKPVQALALIEDAYSQGQDLRVLTRHLIEYLHGAILAKVEAPRSAVLELSDEEWTEIVEISKLRSLEEIELIFQVLHHGLEWIARSPQPKVVLDVLIVKCATADALVFADAAGSASGSHGNAGPKPVTVPEAVVASAPKHLQADAAPIPTKVVTVAAPAPVIDKPPVAGGPKNYETFIQSVRNTKPLLASILEHGSCFKFPQDTNTTLEIAYKKESSYFCEQLQSRSYHLQLVALAKDFFGDSTILRVEMSEDGESTAARKERELQEKQQTAKTAASNHPLIREAKSLFGGELGPIELSDDGGSS